MRNINQVHELVYKLIYNQMETNKVVVYETPQKAYDPIAMLNNQGIQRLQHDVGDTNRDVKDSEAQIRYGIKDSEAEIRHDILFEGQENLRTTEKIRGDILLKVQESECAISKEVLETKHTLAKDIMRSEYESKLAIQDAIKEIQQDAKHNAERTQDKAYHFFEELNEKLEECCYDARVRENTQEGLLNQLVKGLLK